MKLCPHCLSPLESPRDHCPFCGKSLQNQNPAGTLAFASLLGERYTLGRFVQADGEGVTYEGADNTTGQRVMIREYLPVTLAQGRVEGRLEPKPGREVLFKTNRMDFADLYRTLQRITPATGLVTVQDVIEENDTVYAVTEVCKGQTLEKYLSSRKSPLKPAEARSLMQPVLEGVAALHKEGLVHRGISPETIFILQGGKACLGGYATLGLRTRGSELKEKLFEGYSAPEQYAPEQFAGRYTDVYALAAVFYRILTGTAPLPAPQRLVRDSMPTVREMERDVPGYLSAVLSRAMRLTPAERVQNVPELMGVLASQNAANVLLDREEAAEVSRRRKGKGGQNQYALLMTVLVVICILLMLICWLFLRREGGGGQEQPSGLPASSALQKELYVPDLVGLSYEEVNSDPELAPYFRFYVAEHRYDSDTEPGTVIEQSPTAGQPVAENALISLVISQGPHLVEMPYILGFTQENAVAELNSRGISFSLLTLTNDGSYVSGCVADVDVPAGTEIDVGKVIVNVYIADERPPEVLGNQTGESQSGEG